MAFALGAGGAADFWDDISYGSINFAGSEVKGWYTMSASTADSIAHDRGQRMNDCISAAAASSDHYTTPAGRSVMMVTQSAGVDPTRPFDLGIDNFGGGGYAYVPPQVNVGDMVHESGHGIGLNHSFSDDPVWRDADWAQIGEYDDPWDVMSFANTFTVPTTSYGDASVGMNAYHLDRMGWLGRSRIMTFGSDGNSARRNVTIAALNHPEASGPMLVRVPFDPGDLNHYYTIEFRKKDGGNGGWSAGIPANIVLIHEVKKGSVIGDLDTYYSFLLLQRSAVDPNRDPVQSVNANGVSISVVSINAATNQATVSIGSEIAGRCVMGYVWRGATPTDHVCVIPATRTETTAENAAAASRRAGSGAFGPDTCISGFVWRAAVVNDHVCVPVASRTRASQDNAAADRTNPARIVYGPNTCTQGFVWREADDRDWVCVTPDVRTLTGNDNAQAPSRRAPGGGAYGPDTCIAGFVWRAAFPTDHVCVTPATRSQATSDNAAAASRLMFQ